MGINSNILFLENSSKRDNSLMTLWKILNKQNWVKTLSNIFNRKKYYIVQKPYKAYSEFLTDKNITNRNIERIIIFGYKDNLFPVLNSLKTISIGSQWFDINLNNCIVVCFASNGAQLFYEPTWVSKFKGWVSFYSEFDFLTDLNIPEAEIHRIYNELFDAILTNSNTREIRLEMIKIYENALTRIVTKYDDQDSILFAYKLNFNKSSIVSS